MEYGRIGLNNLFWVSKYGYPYPTKWLPTKLLKHWDTKASKEEVGVEQTANDLTQIVNYALPVTCLVPVKTIILARLKETSIKGKLRKKSNTFSTSFGKFLLGTTCLLIPKG